MAHYFLQKHKQGALLTLFGVTLFHEGEKFAFTLFLSICEIVAKDRKSYTLDFQNFTKEQ